MSGREDMRSKLNTRGILGRTHIGEKLLEALEIAAFDLIEAGRIGRTFRGVIPRGLFGLDLHLRVGRHKLWGYGDPLDDLDA
jgi:hypothetical protein